MLLLLAPAPEGLSTAGWRMAALFAVALVLWATEAIPIAVTALLVLVLQPILGIADLREIAVPKADSAKRLGRGGAYDVVDVAAQCLARLRRGNGNGHDDRLRIRAFDRRGGGQHRRSRCESVVDEDHGLVLERDRRAIAAVEPLAAIELGALARDNCLERGFRHM